MNTGKPIRILIADDHDIFRRGLADVFEDEPDLMLDGEARDGVEVVELSFSRKPDLILMDVHMPGGGGVEAVEQIKARSTVPIIMLTVSERDEDLLGALRAGADGYLLKNTPPRELCDSIRKVIGGRSVLSPEVTARVMQAAARVADGANVPLSRREREVLNFLARGLSTQEISDQLVISPNTVKTHIQRILKKLEASNRAEAVARAANMGWLEDLD